MCVVVVVVVVGHVGGGICGTISNDLIQKG
jgi:hypothetical protein